MTHDEVEFHDTSGRKAAKAIEPIAIVGDGEVLGPRLRFGVLREGIEREKPQRMEE